MKKTVLALFLILCLSSIPFLKDYKTSVVKAGPNPNIIYVPWNFTTIQEAINNASDGDTIFVFNGIYTENVVINKSISLIGEKKETTIINGLGRESVIYIKGVDNVIVKGFTLTRSGTLYNSSGVLIERSSGSIINNNTISNNYNGISLFYSSNIVVHGNNISNNYYEGIGLWWSFNNLIMNNIVSNNAYDGIILYSSQSNLFSANTILNNPYGISLFSSSYSIIYSNNFINNDVQVYSRGSRNFWNCSLFGNYWSNYAGQDLNGDGIGDVPYVIDENGQVDSSPLMGIFSKFDFTCKEEAYEVAIISNSTISDVHFRIGNETGNRILQFNVGGGVSTFGFCRIMIPTRFMKYPYIVLVGDEEVDPVFLDVSNETHVHLYFTYPHENQTVRIISSELYSEYMELLDNYQRLQEYFRHLNMTYYNLTDAYAELQKNFNDLLGNYTRLQNAYQALNFSYNEHLRIYSESISDLLNNFNRLQSDYQGLNISYNELLLKYSENVDKVQNLTYMLAVTTAILIIVTAYLSKRAHAGIALKRFRESE